jgi:hypothetical protein
MQTILFYTFMVDIIEIYNDLYSKSYRNCRSALYRAFNLFGIVTWHLGREDQVQLSCYIPPCSALRCSGGFYFMQMTNSRH